MTGPEPGRPPSSWRAAVPELVIAVILVAAVSAAGYALAGPAVPAAVAVGVAVLALIGFRVLVEPDQPPPPPDLGLAAGLAPPPSSVTGFWRKRGGLADGVASMPAYDTGLRQGLQHLLAARLAERHGASLRDDPDLARRLLLTGERDDSLWYWIDPARPAVTEAGQPGIPPRTLARLIDRLEQL
ncbi:MAG: hypothetical protein ABJB47_06965 [Actinomycetota bacterium]